MVSFLLPQPFQDVESKGNPHIFHGHRETIERSELLGEEEVVIMFGFLFDSLKPSLRLIFILFRPDFL